MTDRFDPVARLQQLRAASDRITSNLLELDGDATVAMLDAADLRGVTAERWQAARGMLANLFAAHTELKHVIEAAARLCGRSWLLTADRLKELESLLNGPSVVVSDAALQLPDRRLLSESRTVVRRTPDELIEQMAAWYDDAKAVVVGVGVVWDALIPRLRAERQRSLALVSLAEELGIGRSDVAVSASSLRNLSDAILSDPLGVDARTVDTISAEFSRAEEELNELVGLRDEWPERVAAARSLFDEALRTIDECQQSIGLATSRIVVETPIAPTPPTTEILASFEGVSNRADEDWESRAAALITWRHSVSNAISDARAITKQCETLIGQRDELRARLDAYAAKAARLGLLEDSGVHGAYEQARTALYTAPTDLDLADRLVVDYGQLLTIRGRS